MALALAFLPGYNNITLQKKGLAVDFLTVWQGAYSNSDHYFSYDYNAAKSYKWKTMDKLGILKIDFEN